MKKSRKLFAIFLVFIAVTLLSGCYLTSQLLPMPQISITVPSVEFPSEQDSYQSTGALPSHVQFESTVSGKVWYTRLIDDGSYNRRCQSKIQFNTNSKTFRKETFYWERYGNTNTFSFAGTNVQSGHYYYTSNNSKLDYELVEDYNVNAYSSRRNNSYNSGLNSAWFSVDNSEMITWDGNQYISKQALSSQSVIDYTTRRDIKLNY